MKNTFLVVCFLSLLSCAKNAEAKERNVMKLWYDEPADSFVSALPMGNGRLAIMAYGKPSDEIIHLNEETLWSGGPVNKNPNPNAGDYVTRVREALDRGDYEEADKLSRKMQGLFSESYMPVGDLLIHQKMEGAVENYSRELNLETAICKTSFRVNNVDFEREFFVSYPDQVIVMRLSSSAVKSLSFALSMKSLLKPAFLKEGTDLVMSGRAPSHVEPDYIQISNQPIVWGNDSCGMRFQTRVRAIENDGRMETRDDSLFINDASKVTLVVSIATSFNGFDRNPVLDGKNESALVKGYLDAVHGKDYAALKQRHLDDYSQYFSKIDFYLEGDSAAEKRPTNERLLAYQEKQGDYGLEALLFNYGRYLLISSSRRGGIPANLQGKWNIDLRPAWSCNYTMNINLEMNYWAADKMGLEDMAQPLFEQIKKMAVTGRYTAKNFYNCDGFASGHNSDIWGMTNPTGNLGMGKPQWANWCMAFPWLCMHLWDEYLYTGDIAFLRKEAYPIMKGAAEFCQDWLVEDENGFLLTSPSTSPENRFVDKNGRAWVVTKGATNEIVLIRNLFKNTISASKALGIDASFRRSLQQKLVKLLRYRIGEEGDLQEWAEDYSDADRKHRHISHLVGLHPGNDISLWNTPDLFDACKKTLQIRGDEGNGWSRAWKICFWARLLDGNHAYKLLRNTLDLASKYDSHKKPGTYINLLNACPPFQIDGNLGVVEGISEMLLQSHLDEIYLLPALPDAWSNGHMEGIRARGGYICSLQWVNNKLKRAQITAKKDAICQVRTDYPVEIEGISKVQRNEQIVREKKMYLMRFKVKKGETYVIECREGY